MDVPQQSADSPVQASAAALQQAARSPNRRGNSATMRRTQQRPRSWGTDGNRMRTTTSEPLAIKVFNCIVDDRALVAGAKKSTRDGIRKWITGGQIRLFVPLYTLAQTRRLKEKNGRIAVEAQEALSWLDDATSDFPHLITLQGGFDQYEAWSEVEKFALPKTLFSESDILDEADTAEDLPEQTEQKLSLGDREKRDSISSMDSQQWPSVSQSTQSMRSSLSALSPPSSPMKATPSPYADSQKASAKETVTAIPDEEDEETVTSSVDDTDSQGNGVPVALRPLYNYILWLVHQERDPVVALENFIFLSDDPYKNKLAQSFGIRTKTLNEIRYAVARESREARNKQLVQKKENEKIGGTPSGLQPAASITATPAKAVDAEPEHISVSEDEDEVLLKRPPRAPAAMLAAQSPKVTSKAKVLDPNQFARNTPTTPPAHHVQPAQTPVRGSPRGAFRGSVRGRGGLVTPGSGRGAPARDNSSGGNGNGPIDPNSFYRPPPANRMRGGGRRLWIPT